MEEKEFSPLSLKTLVNERYFGETPAIKELFNIYSRFRQKYINVTTFSIGLSKDPDLELFCKKCCDLWGLESMSYIIINCPLVNSFTLTCEYAIDLPVHMQKIVEYSSDGIRFKKNAKVNLMIGVYTGLFCNNAYSDRECFAIFLHEIGHNFQSAMNPRLGLITSAKIPNFILNIVCGILNILNGNVDLAYRQLLNAIASSNKFIGKVGEITMAIKKTPFLSELSDIFVIIKNIPNIIYYCQYELCKPVEAPLNALFAIIQEIMSFIWLPFKVTRYGDEQIADSFAADLGYSADLASAFLKMDRLGQPLDIYAQIPVVNAMVDLWCAPFEAICQLCDEHPTTGARIKGNLDIMSSDLNNGYLDPKMKKLLQKDINDTKKVYNDFVKQTHSLSYENKHIFSQLMLICIIDNFDGGIKYKMFKNLFKHSEEKEKSYQIANHVKENYFFDKIIIK